MTRPDPHGLILDFGGVVTRTLFETHDLSEAALGLAPGTLTWRGPFDPDNDPLWQDMQADRISERDYWMRRTRETGALVGADWTKMADFVRAARGLLRLPARLRLCFASLALVGDFSTASLLGTS